ncbi:hypothetical protein R6Q59_018824 [Mikania micrantha]
MIQNITDISQTNLPTIAAKTEEMVIQKRVHGSQHTLRLFIVPFISLSIGLPQLDFIRITNLQTSLPKSSRFCFSRFNAPQREDSSLLSLIQALSLFPLIEQFANHGSNANSWWIFTIEQNSHSWL